MYVVSKIFPRYFLVYIYIYIYIYILDFLVGAFVGLAPLNTAASDAGSDFDLSVKILSGFFIGNILLLKLLRTFCLASKKNF